MYCNSGGIGFLVDGSDLAAVATFPKEPLRLMRGPNRERLLEVPPPADGWTTHALLTTVALHENLISQQSPVDAYLGSTWVGSTEL